MIEYLTSIDFLILIVKIVVIFGAVMNVVGLSELGRTQNDGARTDASGTQTRRSVRITSAAGGPFEIRFQRRGYSDKRERIPLHCGTDCFAGSGFSDVRR